MRTVADCHAEKTPMVVVETTVVGTGPGHQHEAGERLLRAGTAVTLLRAVAATILPSAVVTTRLVVDVMTRPAEGTIHLVVETAMMIVEGTVIAEGVVVAPGTVDEAIAINIP